MRQGKKQPEREHRRIALPIVITNFIFRINEPKTADFLSQAIGERQVIKKVESRQLSPRDIGSNRGISDQEKIERLFLPTELQNLADFEAVLKISNFGVSQITVPQIFFNSQAPHFVMRQFETPNIIYDKTIVDSASVQAELTSVPASAGEVLCDSQQKVTNREQGTALPDAQLVAKTEIQNLYENAGLLSEQDEVKKIITV